MAPFGRLAEPATPGELLTGRTVPPLRVLCLWNARTVSSDIVVRSWPVDVMTPDELRDAERVLESLKTGTDLPEHLVRRVGPPLMHPDDPRQVYVHRERLRLDRFAQDAGETYPLPRNRDLPMAAEDREPYGPHDRRDDDPPF